MRDGKPPGNTPIERISTPVGADLSAALEPPIQKETVYKDPSQRH